MPPTSTRTRRPRRAPAPRGRGRRPFGSVWDSQLGTPAASTARVACAARRRRGLRRARDPRVPDRRAARQPAVAAVGRRIAGRVAVAARTSRRWSVSATAVAAARRRGGGGGGINRYPDVSGRTRSSMPPREDRAPVRRDEPTGPGAAQLERAVERCPARARGDASCAGRGQAGTRRQPTGRSVVRRRGRATERPADDVGRDDQSPKPRTTRKPAASATGEKAAAKPRASRKAGPAAGEATVAEAGDAGRRADGAAASAPKAAAKPRAARKPAAAKAKAAPVAAEATAEAGADDRRRQRRSAARPARRPPTETA